MHMKQAAKYLKDTTFQKQYVLFSPYNSVADRYAQAKQWAGHSIGGPKSAEILLHVLKGAEGSAKLKGLNVPSLVTEHSQLNKVPKMRHLPTELTGG